MDWLHCNKCYQKPAGNVRFSITSCKHIFCQKCIERDKCSICGSACKHLALTDNMPAYERMYFKKPVEICRKYLEHIAQVSQFQRKQTELLISFYKHKISKMEAALQEAQCKIRSQEKESAALKNQVNDMKKMLTLARASPNSMSLRRASTPRPIAITSPSSRVTPKQTPQSIGSSRPESVGHITGSSVSRSGGFLTPRGSSVTSGRSTPRDATMGSPSAGSGDSFSYRSMSRTPTLISLSLSGGRDSSQGYSLGDAGLPSRSTSHVPLVAYNSPLNLGEPNFSGQAPSVNSEPRRPIQLNATPRTGIFRLPTVPASRNAME
uniref:E3 ubiquitin-protein ligase RNF212B-like isoform X2 n=1 Tax=Pristiophorus japonicus TaxID=55135 RepID=UPI00398F3962